MSKRSEWIAAFKAAAAGGDQLEEKPTAAEKFSGKNFTWELRDGVLTISGSGPITLKDSYSIWKSTDEGKNVKILVLSDGVTEIRDSFFSKFRVLEKVVLPKSIINICDDAFAFCKSLKSVVTSSDPLQKDAAALREQITNTSAKQATAIGVRAFCGCSSLESVSIPEKITHIKRNAFQYCKNLKNVFAQSIVYIDNVAFADCNSLESITFGDRLTWIDTRAFEGCRSLKSLSLPDSLTYIAYSAFEGCSSFESFIIPNSITAIHEFTFDKCSSLKKITIPSGIVSIERDAFCGCTNLRDIYYSGSKQQWSCIKIAANNDILQKATIHFNCKDRKSV